jgi:hypothetical protein
MPTLHPCLNHDVCGNYVAVGDKSHLCPSCREIARNNERDERTRQEYVRLNQRMRKPTFQEIERGVK